MFWEGINQRKFPRAEYKCHLRLVRKSSSPEMDAYTSNIGAGGICVILEEPVELFEDVELELYIKGRKEPVTCTGTVVWVVKSCSPCKAENSTFDTGIEFLNITREDKKYIEMLVQKLLNS